MGTLYKAGMPGREVEFLALADGESPPRPYIEVTYRHIDGLFEWQYSEGVKINRTAFWREFPRVYDALRDVTDHVRDYLRVGHPELVVDPFDPVAVAKFQRHVAETREGRRLGAAIEELRAIARKIVRLRAWIEDVAGPPEGVTREVRYLQNERMKHEGAIYNAISSIRSDIEGMEPFIGADAVRTVTDEIRFSGNVVKQSSRTDRITTSSDMRGHLQLLKDRGFVDWFELNIVPPTTETSFLVENAHVFVRRTARFILFRYPTYRVTSNNTVQVDKNRVLCFAPALFRAIRAMQEVTANRALGTMFGRYIPVVRSNQFASRQATLQAVQDAVLASPIGEDIQTMMTKQGRYPSPLEMSLVDFYPFVVPSSGGESIHGSTMQRLAETYSFAKPVFGNKGGWSANMDVVWWWVYGTMRQKGAMEAYSADSALPGGEIDRAIDYVRRVMLARLHTIHLYDAQAQAARTVLRGDYQFIAREAIENAQELVLVLEEEKQWRFDPARIH